MNQQLVHAEAAAALTRLKKQHPELKEELAKAWGFAVFPSVGRASAVLGGAYGHGEVFEQGKSIGFATLSQISIGVQLGGQTFSQVVIFPKKEQLDEFRGGKVAFSANASAVIVKAAASGTANFDGIVAHAYSRGGMLLEATLGGQKYMFIPPAHPLGESEEPEKREAGEGKKRETSSQADVQGKGRSKQEQKSDDSPDSGSGTQQHSKSANPGTEATKATGELKAKSAQAKELGKVSGAKLAKMVLRKVGSRVADKVREVGKHVPVLKKDVETSERLHAEVAATLDRMKAKDPSLEKAVDEAYAYAVFPAVGKASLVLGGTYGKGEVFREGEFEGYAAITQLTIGLQLGGQTFSQLILFQDEDALKRLKEGKIGFAANASAVIVKGGAAATNNYKQGMQIYVHTEGGLAAEAAIGGQKLVYVPAALSRGKSIEEETAKELGRERPAAESHPPS